MAKCNQNEDKIWGIFDKRPLIWFHYVLLVVILFIAHYFSGFLEQMVVQGQTIAWLYIALWYYVWFSIGDQLIHKVLGVD